MGLDDKMVHDVTERADSLTELFFPDVTTLIDNIIDEWYENHTTLSGERGQLFKAALKRRTRQTLAAKLAADAARFE